MNLSQINKTCEICFLQVSTPSYAFFFLCFFFMFVLFCPEFLIFISIFTFLSDYVLRSMHLILHTAISGFVLFDHWLQYLRQASKGRKVFTFIHI